MILIWLVNAAHPINCNIFMLVKPLELNDLNIKLVKEKYQLYFFSQFLWLRHFLIRLTLIRFSWDTSNLTTRVILYKDLSAKIRLNRNTKV